MWSPPEVELEQQQLDEDDIDEDSQLDGEDEDP
jgi:hypothetical protein